MNGYDCGPFAAADVVALLASDTPSTKLQRDMPAWREEMASTVRALRQEEFVPRAPPAPDTARIIEFPRRLSNVM